MATPNIVWCRVDNRLLHGQVQLWIKALNCNLVLCVNDEASANEFQQDLMKVSIPAGIGIRFFTLEKTIKIIDKALPSQSILMCVKDLEDLETLIQNGVPIKEVNVGNIHDGPGKIRVTRTVYLGENDKKIIKRLLDQGIKFNTKTSPGGFDTAKDADLKKYV